MSDPKTYTDDFAKFADRINRIEASIRNLRVPTDGQFTQTVKKILALFDSLDQQVADSISKNSYDKATIDSKLQDWNWGTLTPGRGGTGTTNGYNNLFTKGQWRAGWILTDYQTLSVAALRLAQDAETRIDDLAQRLTQLEKRNQQ